MIDVQQIRWKKKINKKAASPSTIWKPELGETVDLFPAIFGLIGYTAEFP